MNRPAVAVTAMVLIALAGAAVWYLSAGERPTSAASSAPSPATAVPTGVSTEPAAREPREASLPPESRPLPERLAALEAAARAGHAEAACRLVVERLRCERLLARPAEADASAQEARLVEEGRLEEANEVARRQLLNLERRGACEQVGVDEDFDALDWLAMAAAQGHPAASVLYFRMGESFRAERGIYRDPGFDPWRRDAPGWLQRAYEGGLPEANAALAEAYASDSDFASGLVADDPERAFLHKRLDFLLRDQAWPSGAFERRWGLKVTDVERLEAEARRLHLERFGGRHYRLRPLVPYQFEFEPETPASAFCGALR